MNTSATLLTKENAHLVSTISNINHPEWGTKKFNHNDQELTEGKRCSTFGSGPNSAILFDDNFKFWQVAAWK